MTRNSTDILICGGGAPGLALAYLLAGAGLDVAVIERGAFGGRHPGDEGRTTALMQGSINILRAAGVWEAVEPYTAPLRILRIVDESGRAPLTADFQAREIGLDAFGRNTPTHVLTSALAARAAAHPRITLLPGVSFVRFGAGVGGFINVDTTGPAMRARLCIAADGRNSAVRQAAGIAAQTTDYGQQALTFLIGHSRPHDDISTEFHRPGGPFTLVPLPGRTSSVVWVDFTKQAQKHIALNKKDFARAVQERSANALGRIEILSAPSAFPLSGLRARRLTAPRVALMAEAAHVLHPLGAQGLNLSIRDTAMLAEIIADAARLGQDFGGGDALQRYERSRRTDLDLRARGTDGLNTLVSNDLGLLQTIRRTGLQAVSGVAPLKKFIMREGLSPGMDSRLARGEAL